MLLMIINGKSHYFDWAMASSSQTVSLPEGKPPFSYGFPMVFLWFSAFTLGSNVAWKSPERNSAKPRRGTAGDLSSIDVFTTLGMLRDDWGVASLFLQSIKHNH